MGSLQLHEARRFRARSFFSKAMPCILVKHR